MWKPIRTFALRGVLFSTLLFFLAFPGCGLSKEYVQSQIDEAKSCKTAEDCVDVGSKCPFGCSIVVNKAEATRIKDLVDGYQTNCVYDCLAPDKIVCEAGQCKQTYKQ